MHAVSNILSVRTEQMQSVYKGSGHKALGVAKKGAAHVPSLLFRLPPAGLGSNLEEGVGVSTTHPSRVGPRPCPNHAL